MSTVKVLPAKDAGNSTNGTPAKTTTPAQSTAIPPVPFVDGKLQPLDERLHRLNQLFEMQTKYNRLQKSLVKLNEFKQETGSENLTLVFRSNDRNEFSTSNPAVIGECIQNVKNTIKAKLKEIEPLLKW